MRVQVDINRINFRSGDKLDLPVSLWVDGRTAEDSGYIFGNLRLKHRGVNNLNGFFNSIRGLIESGEA